MHPVVDLNCPLMEWLYNRLIIIALSMITIQSRTFIEQSILMQYNILWQDDVWLVQPEWIQHFEKSIQIKYAKINKYTPRDWRVYNERKDSGYVDGYNQGHTEGHDDGWDEAKEYYPKIFQRELREAKQ